MNNYTQVIVALIGFLGTILTAVIVPLINANTTQKQRDYAQALVDSAVWAVERFKEIDPEGTLRKETVVEYLNKHKIKLTEEDLDMMIQEAVEHLNQAQQALK